jgi:hypothetical protein
MKFKCNRYFVFGIAYIAGMILIGIASLGRFYEAYIFSEYTLITLIIMSTIPFVVGYLAEVEFSW